ncbi:hypothetical protein [Shimia sagamensis]|uniref:HTH cro/C1-type domain-containing protein n=2 Tax=Shimia TaxID=573139 RepID=A0ABY1PLB4_9RHOB|nr:hypothetical protein [Shimia sagamensis]SMP36551.1 hypothetical protein SAMN06265373_11716 [Shimia sagamensis]
MERLTGEHGEQTRLAEAMGIDSDKLSKILKGKRRVQAKEVPGALAFFQKEDDDRWAELIKTVSQLDENDQTLVETFALKLLKAKGA